MVPLFRLHASTVPRGTARLGIDVGGTHTNIGVGKSGKLFFSLHFPSQQLPGLLPAIQETISTAKKEFGLRITSATIAGAGPVMGNTIKLSNVKWNISKTSLERSCGIPIRLLNDFEAIGYGVAHLPKKSVVRIAKGKKRNGPISIIGAGTGLGKSLVVNGVPLASEGGHTELPLVSKEEYALGDYIKKKTGAVRISYEQVVSGSGLLLLYSYLTKGKKITIGELSKKKTRAAKRTFELFARFYARAIKNYMLETLPAALYIAGGIAPKHIEIFKSRLFFKELYCLAEKSELIQSIPINVIVDYDAGMYGALAAEVKR